MRFVLTIHVRPKPEVRDPQGEAVQSALASIGLTVANVRTGKEIVVTMDAPDQAAAREAADRMGQELLANPVIEDFSVEMRAT